MSWFRRRTVADFARQRVVLTTKDDKSIRGLVDVYDDCFVLHAPEFLGEAQPVPAVGFIVVLKANHSTMQVLPVGEEG